MRVKRQMLRSKNVSEKMDLRTYLYAHKITREQFAYAIGVSVSSAANKIHGRTPLHVDEAQLAHDKLGIPIYIFLSQ